MICRQVQKVSRGCGPRASESPAMARWKACEWTFAIAGSSRLDPLALRGRAVRDRRDPAVGRRSRPAPSRPSLSGSSARSAQSTVIVTSPAAPAPAWAK